MPTIESISVALPPEMIAQVREAVETGEYASASEVVCEALREWEQKRHVQQSGVADLRQLWQEARADTSPGLEPDEMFDELERKYQAIGGVPGETA